MHLTLHSVVGPSGRNSPEDVMVVRALLNVYRRKVNDRGLPMLTATDPELFAAIARFQVGQGAVVASGSVHPGSTTWQAMLKSLATSRTLGTVVSPSKGRLTWESEGQEGGRGHSRVLRVPAARCGLTLGRGYDLRNRIRVEVQKQLAQAGVDPSASTVLGGGVRLQGQAAEGFIVGSDLLDFELSPPCQLRLFEIAYAEAEVGVQEICARPDVVSAFGAVNLAQLDPRIKEVLIDLHYRGDYTRQARSLIQHSVVQNDLNGFARSLSDLAHWAEVPPERFQRRKRFLA